MARKLKTIPTFHSEDQERDFWAKHNSTDYVDWLRGQAVILPELKPSVRTISLRLPEAMFVAMKALANKRDIPYQSLMKTFLADRIRSEFGKAYNNSLSRTRGTRRKA